MDTKERIRGIMDIDRRGFLKVLLATAAAGPVGAQAQQGFVFTPDAMAVIAGKQVPIDLALLGPNGEETVGFYGSLDPFHGAPFGSGWRAVYDHYMKGNPWNTNPVDIERVLTHVQIHGISREELFEVYKKAKTAWDAQPALRINDRGLNVRSPY
ncbi:MAG: twin-arginine translocation signal domain-containing protein [Alphaproteobacteria bacterium]